MYNDADPPTFRLLPNDGCTSDPPLGIHCMGENGPAWEADDMCEPADPIFNNDHFSHDPHLALGGTNMLHAASAIYPFYSEVYLEHDLFPSAHGFVHQDTGRLLPSYHPCQMANTGAGNSAVGMLEEMESQPILEMTRVGRLTSMSSSTFLDRDVVTPWSETIRTPDHDDYGSLGLLPSRLERTLPRRFSDNVHEGRETTPGPMITGVSPPVSETDASPVSVFPLLVPINWRKIPQRKYMPKAGNRAPPRLQAVAFSVNGVPGFNLQCALNRAFAGLDGRDHPVLESANGPVSCRLLFPGYINAQCSQIAVKNWKKQPAPITKSKLAHEVAKRVYQYLDGLAVVPLDPSTSPQWEIGQGFMSFEKMYLTNVSWVSKGSIQPEIWVDAGGL